MDLDKVGVSIRPRGHWESIDLGFRLARLHWKPLFGAWIIVLAPFATVIFLLLDEDVAWAWFLIWWMKPLLERVPLYVLSRAVFGRTPGIRESLMALPRMLRRGAIAAITIRRVDASRSFSLSVWQLEDLSGRAWRQRLRTLEKRTRSAGVWHTISCMHFEAIIWMSLLALIAIMTPEQLSVEWLAWLWRGGEPHMFIVAVWVVATGLVSPFYVAGGFGLYLNRRAELEGWDIEIAFRRMALRLDLQTKEVT